MYPAKRQQALILVLAGGFIPAAFVGCSGNSSTATDPASMADYSGASTATAAEVTASMGSTTMAQSTSGAGILALPVRMDAEHRDAIAGGKGCGTVVVNATGTTGQVTDETITYALPACQFTGVFGGESLSITGMLELTMPDATGFDFTAKPTALEFAFTDAGVVSSETRTGSTSVSATASSASLVNAMTTQFVKAGTATGTLVNDMTYSFTPASGTSLAAGEALPDGTFQVNGNVSWTKAGAALDSFAISTTAPLVYDASCLGSSASPFDSGQLRLMITEGSAKTYGQITWTNCGAPVVTVI